MADKAGEAADGSKPRKQPNILFLFTDQMRGDAMGCVGNPTVKTPNLDMLAAGGALFPTSYCQTPVCIPSRCSIFTGKYPHATGTKDNGSAWPTHVPNIPTVLRDNGYRTVSVGKMHFWPDLWASFGFDKRIHAVEKGFDFGDDYQKHLIDKGLLEAYRSTLTEPEARRQANLGNESPLPEEDYIDSFVAASVMEEIRAADDQPWFIWAGFPSPHAPTNPPAPWSKMYRPEDMPLAPFDPKEFETKPHIQQAQVEKYKSWAHGGAPDKLQRFLAHYYGLVSLIDKLVGDIVATLKATGQYENTLICFGSDHGEFAGDHGAVFKGFALWECLTRVPMIMHWPAGIEHAGTHSAYAENVDIFPTFLDAAGIENPWGLQGRSLLPVANGEVASVRDYAFSEYLFQKMIRKGDWKLIHYAGHALGELYNLAVDPYEACNLYTDPKCREIRDELQELLLTHLVATENPGEAYQANYANAFRFQKEPDRGSL